ncbi:MAG: recombinase family protein [Aestuariivirga sp.]|uniref:recombinase family protein n=1 Tax=Aestuariivirga sp. TaxID=2650926 RepID=UPI0038D1EE45
MRYAIYTRKSSEEGLEQEFNSLDAQRGACEAYIASQRSEGWALVRDQYDDGGISGGTLDRPSLQRLLSDIEDGLVDVVVVYKIDRLSRSLIDFSKLVEVFDRNNVTFVSVPQSFNTTTSMGRLTLNILLSFAQFEREVTAAFSPTHTRKGDRLYRYYLSQTVLKHGAGTCPVPRVPTAEIELAVIDQLRAMLWAPEVVVATWKAARFEQDEVSEADVRDALTTLDPLWAQLFPIEQARVVQLLIDRVEVGTGGLKIRFRDRGLAQMVTEVGTVAAKTRKAAA